MGDQPSILFVDDEDSIRLTLPPLLQSYGFGVTAAATVAEALGLISQHRFDVLICDLNIGHPGDGFTVVSAMRSHQPNALRFILTAYPAFESALEAIREEVHDYFVKPTETEVLVEKIRSKLAQRSPDQSRIRQRLTIEGIVTGTVLTIINSDPATPLTAEQYPLGKLIALSDPSASVPN